MNTRERFLAVMNFDTSVRTLKWEMGYWVGAVRRWYNEGLTRKVGVPDRFLDGESVSGPGSAWYWERARGDDVNEACNLDGQLERVPVDLMFSPRFEDKILEVHDDWMIRQDEYGVRRKEPRDRSSLPRFVGWPVQNRDDWERLKAERLRPSLEGRLPANWEDEKKRFKQRDFPLGIGGGYCGFFGAPRNLLGEENLLVGYYDDPQFIKDIINDLCTFWIGLFDNVLAEVDVDAAFIWEDMCYKTGPLVSPALVREFMLPAYERLTGFLRDHGVKIVLLDTDGDCWSLIPIFLEGGVTGLYPFEVNANMDVVAVRKAFPRLQMLGCINKVALAQGRDAIDRELEAKVPPLLKLGGYIPYVDHVVPPDVSWSNFLYYRQRLNKMIEQG